MKTLDTNLPTSLRRGAIRMDQDGPWSVSVAETPYDAYSFSLYIKSEFHRLFLLLSLSMAPRHLFCVILPALSGRCHR